MLLLIVPGRVGQLIIYNATFDRSASVYDTATDGADILGGGWIMNVLMHIYQEVFIMIPVMKLASKE